MAALSLGHADWTEKVTLNGYFSFEFEERIAGERHERADEYGSFDSDMFDLVLNIQATDRLRLAADLTWEHGAQSEVDKGNLATEYAFAEFTVNDYLKIRAGKMFTPFGIYNEIHTAKPATIILKEPDATNKMYFISSDSYEQTLLYPRWGSGVALLGDAEIAGMSLDYIVQVANGDVSYGVDANEFDHDDNEEKAVTARVRLDVTDDLQLGASFHTDVMTRYQSTYVTKVRGSAVDSDGDTYDIYSVSKEYLPVGRMRVDSQGAQLIWHVSDAFRLEAEYVTGTLDVEGVTRFGRSGYSILPSYLITDRLNLYLLYTEADPNHNNDDDKVVKYAPGINYELDENMFIKSDLYYVTSEKNNPLFEGRGYSEFRAALAIGF
jgi:hypothetical protein